MGTYYNTKLPDVNSLVCVFDSVNPKCYVANSTIWYSTPFQAFSMNANFIADGLNLKSQTSNPAAALTGLSLNSYSGLTFIVSTLSQSDPDDKKGSYFGAIEGWQFASASTQISSDTPLVLTTTSAVNVAITATNYSSSTQITSDTPLVLTTTSAVNVAINVTTYSSSTQTTSDTPVVLTTTSAVNVDITGTNYSSSTQIAADTPLVNTTNVTGTQCGLYLPVNEILLQFDRGSRALNARTKSGDTDLILSVPYTPSSGNDKLAVVIQKTPTNTMSLYINGVIAGSATSSGSINNFPNGNLRIFANGASCDELETSIGTFAIYNRAFTDSEVLQASVIR